MTSRESIDSTGSTSPLIQGSQLQPQLQPPPRYYQSDAKVASNDTASKITISAVVLGCRVVAFIASLAIGINLAVLEVWRPVHIALTVFTWVSATWNGLLLIAFLHKPFVRVSLVLGDGKVISLGSHGKEEEEAHRRRRCPRAFWVDILLVSATFGLNVASLVVGGSYGRTTMNVNWILM